MLPPDERNPARELINEIERVLKAGETAVLATLLTGDLPVGTKILIRESGNTTSTQIAADLKACLVKIGLQFLQSRDDVRVFKLAEVSPSFTGSVLLERLRAEPRVVICGAGHVGAALARLSIAIGFRVTLVDDRPEFVSRELFAEPQIELCAATDWAESVRRAIGNGRGVSVAIVTRGHNQDEECLRAVVPLKPDYVGLIGSKRRTNIVLERLRVAGFAEEDIRRVHAPIGLDIGAVTPEEVALSILAEIVAERRGGRGGSLSEWRRSVRGS
jgi:xanthine dehydrogenase accessory factor